VLLLLAYLAEQCPVPLRDVLCGGWGCLLQTEMSIPESSFALFFFLKGTQMHSIKLTSWTNASNQVLYKLWEWVKTNLALALFQIYAKSC
jgi:hypothetical protein